MTSAFHAIQNETKNVEKMCFVDVVLCCVRGPPFRRRPSRRAVALFDGVQIAEISAFSRHESPRRRGMLEFLKGPMRLMANAFPTHGEVFSVPVCHKRITFLLGPKVSQFFFKAKDVEMSQKEVYEFNVPTFGKGFMFDVDHQTRAEQFRSSSRIAEERTLENVRRDDGERSKRVLREVGRRRGGGFVGLVERADRFDREQVLARRERFERICFPR